MDTLTSPSTPIPSIAQSVIDWIVENSTLSRDTIKTILSSQQFPYVEDQCLESLRDELIISGKTSVEQIEKVRRRVTSISQVHFIKNGFVKKALAVLDSFTQTATEGE